MTRRRRSWVLLAIAVVGAMAGVAHAFWSSTDSSNFAAALADTLPQGAAPTATRTNATTVAISFTRAVTSAGTDVTSYAVKRYSSAGATTPSSTFICSWASGGPLVCSEPSVPGGTWYYTDTPAIAGSLWVGTESAKSNGVTTDLAAPTASVTSISPTPNGGGYNNTSPVTVNLSATDNPAGAGGSGVASITYWVDAGSTTTVSGSTAAVAVTGDGAHVVSYFATDNVGNASSTQTQGVTIDTAAPVAPSVPDLASASDSGSSSTDNVTSVATPTFTGTAESGAAITIFDGATQVGSGTATGGNYSIATSTLGSGAHSITAKATDAAGNTSSASSALSVTIDSTAPTAPSVPDLAAGSDTGTSSTDNLTSATTPTFTGTAEAASTVTIFDGATQVGSGTATGGNYSIVTSTLSSGAHSITAKATDAAGNTSSASSSLTVTVDTSAPVVGTTVIAKTTGYLAGSIKQLGTFYVYANVTDASGISTVTANNSTLVTSGGTTVSLVAGSYSVGGVTYNFRSASQTAKNPLTAGAYTYSITSTDEHGNSATQSSFPVTVDNTVPTASDVQTANASGGTVGKAEGGDTITFTFAEPIDPESVLTTWTGASSNVVLHLVDGGCTLSLCSPDSVEIWNAANTTQLPLGSVNLNRGDYNGNIVLSLFKGPDITFGASGTASTMVKSGSTITVTLGTVSGSPNTAAVASTMQWTPSGTPYDAAGNLGSTAPATESGSADKEF